MPKGKQWGERVPGQCRIEAVRNPGMVVQNKTPSEIQPRRWGIALVFGACPVQLFRYGH